MARTAHTHSAHPARDPKVEAVLTEQGINFDFVDHIGLDDIKDVEGMQVRLVKHRAPHVNVNRYATAMKAGATFPAIVVDGNYAKIDGNTRVEAARKTKKQTIAAYVCPDITPVQARLISGVFNDQHGEALTNQERHNLVLSFWRDGQTADPSDIARTLGMREHTVKQWIAEAHFDEVAAEEVIEERYTYAFKTAHKAALERVTPPEGTRALFKQATVLASQAQLKATEIQHMCSAALKALNEGSETDALAVITAERDRLNSEGRLTTPGLRPRQRRSARSAQHIGALVRFEAADLLDVAPEKRTETLEKYRVLRDRFATVVERAEGDWIEDEDEAEAEAEVEEVTEGKSDD